MTSQLSVTQLAEFVHRRGDLHHRKTQRARPEEGIVTQRALQQHKAEDYERERRVEASIVLGGETYVLRGRIDGCRVSERLVEEFKTVRADHVATHAQQQSVHWAQLQLYGALLHRELDPEDDAAWTLRLVYAHPDTLATTQYERQCTVAQLRDFMAATVRWYGDWLAEQSAHRRLRDRVLTGLEFPYPDYRPHQRALARRAYRALRDGERLLLEAPTGSGKTMGLLYPALKALPDGPADRIFFLTSRSTGANAAREASDRIDGDGKFLRVVQITAKATACAWVNERCEGTACEFALGYFDRIHAAVRALLEQRRMTQAAITAVARTHRVCPFELTLDAARWADVVIGDYNYVFDPMVRLQRFAGDPRMALLIDESHQLSTRAQDMLALALDRVLVRRALDEALPAELDRRVRAVDRQLRDLARDALLPADGTETVIAEPTRLLAALARLVDTLAATEVDLAGYPEAQQLCFEALRWVRSRTWTDAACIYLATAPIQAGRWRSTSVRMAHLDPGKYVAEVLAAYAGHIRFSGTVSPLPLYARLHGMPDDPAERAASPFSSDQLAVCIVDDVPTYYRARHTSLDRLASLIAEISAVRQGNYLVAFPSFDYLRACERVLQSRFPGIRCCAQTPAMDTDARLRFMHQLAQPGTCVGLVVLGGIFAESVSFQDIHGSTLAGIICVGVGLPPPSTQREAMADYFDDNDEDGQAIAYLQPAMNKVLQVAGRLLRGPEDKGVLCLVDERFKVRAYQRFFPAHWRPRSMSSPAVAPYLENFWQPDPRSPRLRAARSPIPVHQPPEHPTTV